jgi:uncharacterized repeat protein (TIGR03803 family)
MNPRRLKSAALRLLPILVLIVAAGGSAWAAQEKVLHTFLGSANGNWARGGLVADGKGNLYGTAFLGGAHYPNDGTVFKLTPTSGGGWKRTVLHSFSGADGLQPTASMIFDAAGNLYGTTQYGGASGNGVVFKLVPGSNGHWTETVLYSFSGGTDGGMPEGSVVFDKQGNLYGTTSAGGDNQCQGDGTACGVVFKLAPGSHGKWIETVLYAFTAQRDGAFPVAGLVLDKAGNLYGTTQTSAGGGGNVFELTQSKGKWTFSVLYQFTGGNDGSEPLAPVIFDDKGNLYGTTSSGGSENCSGFGCGTVFELAHGNGSWTESVLYALKGGADGAYPQAGLAFDAAWNLYGTTDAGGGKNAGHCYLPQDFCGTVFQLKPNGKGKWTESVLHSFGSRYDGGSPFAGIWVGAKGQLYGTTYEGGPHDSGTVFELAGSGTSWKETILDSFAGVDGANGSANLIFDSKGNFYGTTGSGGENRAGTVFQMAPAGNGKWKESILHSFSELDPNDGAGPAAGVIFDDAGNLYGTTALGGANGGWGTVFKLEPDSNNKWKVSILYSFKGGSDGGVPYGGVIFDAKGNLYGTTSGDYGDAGRGTVFELVPANGTWSEKVLYAFKGGQDGDQPLAGLVSDSAGNLYGTTYEGGAYNSGTVFELTQNSKGKWSESVLHTFTGGSDGYGPLDSLIMDASGNLYGTTQGGGGSGLYGTVFELTKGSNGQWTESVLHDFVLAEGIYPGGNLTFDAAGNLYGAAADGGGSCDCGTAFELTPAQGGTWNFQVLHKFAGAADGSYPAALALDSTGNLYGEAYAGGTAERGVVFQITP